MLTLHILIKLCFAHVVVNWLKNFSKQFVQSTVLFCIIQFIPTRVVTNLQNIYSCDWSTVRHQWLVYSTTTVVTGRQYNSQNLFESCVSSTQKTKFFYSQDCYYNKNYNFIKTYVCINTVVWTYMLASQETSNLVKQPAQQQQGISHSRFLHLLVCSSDILSHNRPPSLLWVGLYSDTNFGRRVLPFVNKRYVHLHL